MVLLILSILWAAVIALLLIRAVRQYSFYQIIEPTKDGATDGASVVVIIPARNEEKNIGRCLEGLLAQQSPPEIRSIIVIDDRSTDATGQIVREIVKRNPLIHLIEGKPLEAGWAGKPHALCEGAQAARAILNDVDESQWLCFMDADTAAQPALLRTALHVAQSKSLDLLSLQPEQELIGPWERLIMPCGFFLVAFTQDVRQANDPNDPNAH